MVAEVRCERCELLVGMGCACPSRKRRRRSGTRGKTQAAATGRTARRVPEGSKVTVTKKKVTVTKTKGASSVRRKAGRTERQPFGPPSPASSSPLLDDDRRAAEEDREEFRDMGERGTSVRAYSGGLPTLGRRRR